MVPPCVGGTIARRAVGTVLGMADDDGGRHQLPDGWSIGAMRRDEADELVSWAEAEGWNPGIGDVGVAWACDPDAFIALRCGDELVGGGTILSYDGAFGFMGFFIVRPEHRGQRLGTALWFARRDGLRARLAPEAAIGMDGVFEMEPFYARGGFATAYRDLRFEGLALAGGGGAAGPAEEALPATVPLAAIDREVLHAYDAAHVPAPRAGFLDRWLDRPDVRTAAVVEDGSLVGYGVLRPAVVGHRFGPVFADRPDVAEALVRDLMAQVSGEQVQLDVPDVNGAALDLVGRLGLEEVFGCARMYLGPTPAVPVDEVYGTTSLEFG